MRPQRCRSTWLGGGGGREGGWAALLTIILLLSHSRALPVTPCSSLVPTSCGAGTPQLELPPSGPRALPSISPSPPTALRGANPGGVRAQHRCQGAMATLTKHPDKERLIRRRGPRARLSPGDSG
ncbi:coiled-coil domain-containing protein 97 [Platysternon megacephalum]|uniref:Coiled-coil domain-containing protein 97 n=1 Tax=Platysternon megacephalum TaxID=55544 RepID=A0A4D9DUH2_9SAUR|nr:coiled-coil domain-containing protein 97 [Platysternon megacephalum]